MRVRPGDPSWGGVALGYGSFIFMFDTSLPTDDGPRGGKDSVNVVGVRTLGAGGVIRKVKVVGDMHLGEVMGKVMGAGELLSAAGGLGEAHSGPD